LGITDNNAAASFIFNTSSGASLPASGAGLGNPTIPGTIFTGAKQFGQADGAGGVQATAAGALFGGWSASVSGGSPTQGAYGTSAPGNLFTQEKIAAVASGTSVYTPSQVTSESGLLTQAPQTNSTTYTTRNFNSSLGDTIGTLPTLTINVTGGSTGTNTTGSNKIISLVTGTNPGAPTGTPPNGYGNTSLGTLDVHNGSPAIITEPGVGVTSGFVAITTGGAHPTEVGIQVDVNGVHATATQIAQIIADINASNNQGNGSLATTTAAAGLSSVFGTSVDIVMPIGSSTNPFFAFDFSGSQSDFTDGDTALGPVTVTAIAAVPEPATAAGVILGAAGLLLGRRKNRAIAA
jgi:hypothetical protein